MKAEVANTEKEMQNAAKRASMAEVMHKESLEAYPKAVARGHPTPAKPGSSPAAASHEAKELKGKLAAAIKAATRDKFNGPAAEAGSQAVQSEANWEDVVATAVTAVRSELADTMLLAEEPARKKAARDAANQ